MSFLRYILPLFLLLLLFWACPIISDPNAAAKGYLFFFFSFLGLLGLILGRHRLHVDCVVPPLVVLAGILFVSSWSSRNPAAGQVFVMALLAAVAYFILNCQLALEDPGAVYLVMAAVALGALLFAGLGAGQFMGRLLLGPQEGMYIPYLLPSWAGGRVSGPFGQPNFHALLMVVGLCAHGYIYLVALKNQLSPLRGWLFSLPVLLLLINLFLTKSRAGSLSLAVVALGLLWWVWHWYREGRKFPCNWEPLVFFSTLLVGSLLLAQVLLSYVVLDEFKDGRSVSIYNRLNNWGASLLMVADYPFLGVGPDNYMIHLPQYQVQARDWLGFEYEDLVYTRWAHNEILQVFAEGGGLGLAALLWFLVAMGRRIFNRFKSADIPFEKIFLSLSLLPFLVQSFFSWPLRFVPLTALFFTLLAFSLDKNGGRWTLLLEFRWLRGALISCLLVFIGTGCWLFYWDWQVGILKKHISDPARIEDNFQQFETLAVNPFIATEVLTWGTLPLINYAIAEDDVLFAQKLIPYVEKGLSLDGPYWQWYNLASLFMTAKDEAGAREAIKTCLELNPIFEPAWAFLHYLNILDVSKATGKPVAELLPRNLTKQEFLDVRYLPSPPE